VGDRDHLKTARILRTDFFDDLLRYREVGEIDPGYLRPGGQTAAGSAR